MIELVGPTGRLIKGSVLDVAEKPFLRALHDLDPQLYVRWNPKKLGGWGCWEIRRRPTEKRVKHVFENAGQVYHVIDYVENDIVCHILDCAYLNYDAIRKLREMDTWSKSHWIHDLEYREKSGADRQRAKAREHLRYALKQNRTAMRDLREMIKSGYNPHILADQVGRLMSKGDDK